MRTLNSRCAYTQLQMGVLHRDIKPDNFLLSEAGAGAKVKLADFGLSCFYTRGLPEKETLGSPYYMAPEMVKKEGYGPAADVWSCGVVLFQCLSRDLPFKVRGRQRTRGVRRARASNQKQFFHFPLPR